MYLLELQWRILTRDVGPPCWRLSCDFAVGPASSSAAHVPQTCIIPASASVRATVMYNERKQICGLNSRKEFLSFFFDLYCVIKITQSRIATTLLIFCGMAVIQKAKLDTLSQLNDKELYI
jgi:hypothetical protein